MDVSYLKNGLLSNLNKRAITKPLNPVREKISDKPVINISSSANAMVVTSNQTAQQPVSVPKAQINSNDNNSSASAAASYQKSYDAPSVPVTTQDIYILV